ncbi:hypothetical protein PFISCL1PPCAC_5513 [Pristionchus fissidentatus]|uniref:3-hydroxyacyl-CoA dehydrogenase NAD binding domain-containing protein n=1 Tax=Pristionchus fissidentatus TaxID=1538716 RepID=A0AAV5V490_9BILA|nr:hypothetical protein PFISCL1PPCAC_5513 [Pristionchus fissidentatus]
MAVAVVVGAGRAAESITKLLLNSGSKVALVGSKPTTQSNLITALKEEAEEAVPFMFVDDLKHQEDHVRRRLARVSFHNDMGSILEDVKIVFDAQESRKKDIVHATRSLFPRTPVASLSSSSSISLEDNLHLGLHLYEPVQITKIAQIVHKRDSDSAALLTLRATLENAGIHEITASEAREADEAMSAWNGSDASSLQSIISTLLGVPPKHELHQIMH